MKHIYTLGKYFRKAILYSSITTILLISLYGCGSTDNSSSNGPQITPPNVPTVTVPVTAGAVTTPLPSNIPLDGSPQLIQEYGSSLNGASATVWAYAYLPPVTASSVSDFYTSKMPSNGWTSIAVPSQTQQSGGTALAFQQGSQTCTIVVASSTSQIGGVALTITLAG